MHFHTRPLYMYIPTICSDSREGLVRLIGLMLCLLAAPRVNALGTPVAVKCTLEFVFLHRMSQVDVDASVDCVSL